MLESNITALEAIAVPTAVAPKSNALISPTTTVAPSSMLSSAGVEVIAVADTAARTGNVPDTFGKLIVLSPVGSTT